MSPAFLLAASIAVRRAPCSLATLSAIAPHKRPPTYLKYQMLWHKVYYKESDVQEFLKTHFKEFEGKNMAKREKA